MACKTKSTAKATGRPSEYNQSIAAMICERLADGESLRSICRDDAMPAKSTVFKWLAEQEGFSDQYVRAREVQADELFEQMLEIADTPKVGFKSVSRPSGVETTEADMIEHRRLQIDARKWVLSKMLPKKYGDKLALGGADDLPPLNQTPDADLDARIAALMAKDASAE